MMEHLRGFVRDERGEDLIEYGLLAAFAAAIFMVLMTNGGIREALQTVFTRVSTALSS
jgi:Flp pilus assembly pilin Flp